MEHDPWASLCAGAAATLSEAIHAQYGVALDVRPLLEDPPAGHGDVALPCFPLAKSLRQAPPAIAQALLPQLQADPHLNWSAAGPYLNGTFDPRELATSTLHAIRRAGIGYGRHPRRRERILVEHTSANPTGPLHVGRARNPILGDTLARVLRAAGHEVTTEYYVNDMGRQVATLVWGLRAGLPRTPHDKGDHRLVNAYQTASERLETEGDAGVRGLIQAFEAGDQATAAAFREAVEEVLEGVRETLARIGVAHDRFALESALVLDGRVGRVLETLRPHLKDDEGARYLDLAGHARSLGKERLYVTRKDGTTLYATRDLAYHLDKLDRADLLVDVLGEDHKLALSHLVAALEPLGVDPQRIRGVFYNFVSLPEGRMSTRKGRVVYMDDLLDEAEERAYEEVRKRRGGELTEESMRAVARIVGVGALRFNIVSVQAEKPITFRWEEALSFDGSTAPFVQYAHARACSILRKARAEGGLEPGAGEPAHLEHPREQDLLKTLARLPSLVGRCADTMEVHPIAEYGVRVADRLNQFYRDCPVVRAEPPLRQARLDLVDAARVTLHATCELLGIHAPEGM